MASSSSSPSVVGSESGNAPSKVSGGRPFTRRHYAPRKSTSTTTSSTSQGGSGEGKTSDVVAHRLIEMEVARLAAARASRDAEEGGGRSSGIELHPYRRSSAQRTSSAQVRAPQVNLRKQTITNLEGEETTYWRFIPPPATRDQRLMGVFKQEAKRNKIGVVPRKRPTAAGTTRIVYPGALANYPQPTRSSAPSSSSSSSSLPSLPSIPPPN